MSYLFYQLMTSFIYDVFTMLYLLTSDKRLIDDTLVKLLVIN